MATAHQKKQVANKSNVGFVVAEVAGAAIIAGAAVAATMVLENKKNREKIKKTLKNVRSRAMDYVEALKTNPNVQEGTRRIKELATDTKKAVEKSI